MPGRRASSPEPGTHRTVTAAVTLATALAFVPAALRWLRVAQREHYLAGSVTRFAARWYGTPAAGALAATGLVAALAAVVARPAALVAAAVAAVGPPGLGLRGRTSPVAWTRRMRTLAAVVAAVDALTVGVGLLTGVTAVPALAAVGQFLVVDTALALTAPVERRAARRWVETARRRLEAIDPVRVAITGSYGKTTVKGYVAHLVAGTRSVVASPASFNNAAGLARAVNEHLAPGTEVFVAEMGTYGPGEIAELCRWVRPRLVAIVAVGPVHLERMGSLETIAAAKAEILDGAETAVVNLDAPGLAPHLERFRGTLIGVSVDGHPGARITAARCGEAFTVTVDGATLGPFDRPDVVPLNAAVAVGLALALGVPTEVIARRLPDLPTPPNRRAVHVAPSGVTVIDDTFNSNPAGAAEALRLLARLGADGGRRVVVTPGMVELGSRQRAENERFAREAARVATDVIVVGRTNRAALRVAREGPARYHEVATREDAVAWVRANLGPGDVVLYENDLPDHYP